MERSSRQVEIGDYGQARPLPDEQGVYAAPFPVIARTTQGMFGGPGWFPSLITRRA